MRSVTRGHGVRVQRSRTFLRTCSYQMHNKAEVSRQVKRRIREEGMNGVCKGMARRTRARLCQLQVIVITRREKKLSLFSFLPFLSSWVLLQPVAQILFAIYISYYAPMTNASVVLANLQSRSFPMARGKKKIRNTPTVCIRRSNYLEWEEKRRSRYARFYGFSREVLRQYPELPCDISYLEISFLPLSPIRISEQRKKIYSRGFKVSLLT